ncbi:peptidoglycan editing factor PgeF [Chitinilyticum piscinae]|uniref:Purine nucleoside phosphorylase n=1 Tax=Chitinilyticum piscinae TaxID=2866724 RepID=A0A8J7FMM8_9NEIS|nr:peptidoglycan editing factor PgeF [Chitinilyticum piscinae]MBE9610350.1 peptidoglycan editing factor PgeF [Chitinilyticum piscinae]
MSATERAAGKPGLILPDWPAPANVHALQTTRSGGNSLPPYASLNLGDHVGDDPATVAANRAILNGMVAGTPRWLNQIHGTTVVDAAGIEPKPNADASYSHTPNAVCVVMTADCLPVLFCDRAGTVVAAAHAGWRGLCNGVLEATLAAMQTEPAEIMAWLGPAIGPDAFEVGSEVREAFIAHDANAAAAFKPGAADGKWLADIYLLARQRLNAAGVTAIYGGDLCTVSDSARFFSYRREQTTGRMASLIWLT